MANNKDVKRGIVLYLDGKQVEASASAVEREMRKVRKEINSCTMGSKEYVEATKRYRELSAILDEHKKKLRAVKEEQKDIITGVNDIWNKWQLAATAVAGAITGVGLVLSKFRKEMNAEEEGADNLKALTGLDDESISWLHQQAVEISTTMDETGLRVKASAKEILDAYTLVGSAKPELLGSKQALLDVTKESLRLAAAAKMDVKPAADGLTLAMNQYGAAADEASRYVNVLAAGSKFGAAGVESQTSAIIKAGVAANVANVPIESLVGSIETLAEKGIKGEVAGTGLKTFFLKLEGMADDVRPSVVGLQTALENLRKKNLSTAETQKMFGLEAYTVASAMINGADKVKQYTESVTDTNTAMEQAAINSDNANAKLEQMKNAFMQQGIILVKELNPAITQFVNLCMNSTKIVVSLTKFIVDNRVTMGLLSAAIGIYIAWVNRKIIADKLAVFWTETLQASMVKLKTAIASNPWGLLLVALTAVVGVLIDYNRRQKEALENISAVEKANEKANKQYAEEASKVDYLNKIVHDNNEKLSRRKEALNELKKIVPDYLADLNEEGRLINDNKKAIDDYLKTLEKEIKLKAAQEDLEDLYRQKRLKEKNISKKKAEENDLKMKDMSGSGGTSMLDIAAFGQNQYSAETLQAIRARKAAEDELKPIAKAIQELEDELRNTDFVTAGTGGGNNGGSGGGGSTSSVKKTVDHLSEQTKAIELEYKKRANILKEQYAKGVIDKKEYNESMTALEKERISELLQLVGMEPSKIADLQSRLLDIEIQAKEDAENAAKELSKEVVDSENELLEERLMNVRQNRAEMMITDEEYIEETKELWREFYEELLSDERLTEEERERIRKEYKKWSLEQSEDEAEKQKQIMERMFDSLKSLGEDIGKELASFITDTETSLGDFAKSVLKIVLDSLEKVMIAAVAERTIKNIATLGFAGVAKAAGEIALITAAFETAKGIIGGFEVGGYTGNGRYNEVAGVVHKDEFVANHKSLANPAVRSVLDVIDSAQKAGTVASLTPADLQAVSGYNGSYAASGSNDMAALISACTATMARVKERFDAPIVAETYATGRGGVNEAQDLVSRMNKNTSR